MNKRSGFYPRVRVDAAGSGVVSARRCVALVETVRVSGLDRRLSQALAPWRKPTARHDPAKVVLDVALSLALGGDCLADVAVMRAAPAVFGPVASDATVSRTVDALAADAPRALAAINTVRAGSGPGVGAGQGLGRQVQHELAPCRRNRQRRLPCRCEVCCVDVIPRGRPRFRRRRSPRRSATPRH